MSGGEKLDDEYWARRDEVITELEYAAAPRGIDIYRRGPNGIGITGDIVDVMEFLNDWRSEIEELA